MPVSLSGVLPSGDHNGLDAIADALTANPQEGQMIVAMISQKSVTTTFISGGDGPKIVATARIVDIEAFPRGSPEWDYARTLLEARRAERTGSWPLSVPLE